MVRPRADNYEERRQEILDNAAVMFAERGFDATPISSIAKRCGVSKALLYHYYQSKEALLYAMLQSHCQLLVETATGAVDLQDRPEQQLQSVIENLMALYMTSSDKHAVLLNELNSLAPEQQDEIKALEKRVVTIIKDILARLRPDLAEPARTALAMYLMGAVNWTYTWFRPDGAVSPEQFADLATSCFLTGVQGELPVL